MDPALFELIESTSEGEEVEIVARLRSPDRTPPGLHVVSRFGNIVTGRVVREELRPVWSHHDIASLKAPRTYYWDPRDDGPWQPVRTAGRRLRPGDRAQRTSDAASGQGVVVGVCDWGIDFAHDDFRNPDGSTRFLAIWNQSDRRGPAPEPFGYGRVYSRDDINHALASSSPYETLGYHPGVQDPLGRGTHGTHVTGIAAGNGRAPGSIRSAAHRADLVFVHLQAGRTPGLTNLGDSTRLLEAIDFVRRTAGKQPWACNCSLGRTGGPHDASTLVEQAIDALLKTPGCAVVMSTGNYNAHHTHAYGVLSPGERRTLEWRVFPSDRTMNELEIWYPGTDRLRVAVRSPDGRLVGRAELSERMAFSQNGHQIGRIYHRSHDPNNADNHIDIFLSKTAPFGTWRVELEAEHVESGRYYAWIERDPGPPGTQSRFNPASVSHECTTAERIAKAFQGAIREGRTHSESYAYTEARTRSSEEDLGRAYSVLGVDPDVSDTTLHEVWRQARKANHPDLVEQDSPEHRRRTRASAELNDAYQYVRESRRRA